MDKEYLNIKEKTKKGYAEAQDGDGVYINRPHQKRGVVQKGMIQTLKTRSARFARRDYPDTVDKYYWKSYFWNNAYFVSTVSENTLANFETYIRKQGMKSKNRLIIIKKIT